MKATEARALNDAYAARQQLDVASIYTKIQNAATRGKTNVSVSLLNIDWGYRDRVFGFIKVILEGEGFKVKRSSWSDPRGDGGDDICVSW